MRQATGSNTPQLGNKVSIQLSLDGHSFSVPALSELPAGEAPVTVELLLPRTMLVPGELFDAERDFYILRYTTAANCSWPKRFPRRRTPMPPTFSNGSTAVSR